MFAIFNPPAGAKYAKKSGGAKKHKARAGKRKMHKARAKAAPRKFVLGKSALDRAREKYCGIGAKRFEAPAAVGDRIKVANSGRRSMKSMKFKVGDYVSMNPPQVQAAYSGALSGVQPKNVTGVAPILGGYICNALFTSAISKFIPHTQAGIGSIALGLVNSGVLGMLAKHFVGAEFARGFVVGARAEPIVRAVTAVSAGGFAALSLKGHWEGDGLTDGFGASGMFSDRPGALTPNIEGQPTGFLGDFSTPGQVGRAQPTESSTSQYSLPNAAAQAPTPQQHMQAYENDAVAAAMGSSGM